ncbi:MAG: hypothetical protein K2N64_07600 [Anaeroplasmataceae bacterium]|nr:hypothetical protein [Anaeroplasmataceae bacterium]
MPNLLIKANTYTSIYQDMEAYKALRTGDQEFFDALFLPLLVYGDLTWSNEEIAENLKKEEDSEPIPVSTVEKRLRRLKEAKLITRWNRRHYDKKTGVWITAERHLRLDSVLFVFMEIEEQEKRITAAKLQAINQDIDKLHPELNNISRQPEEPPPKPVYKVRVSFN